MTQRTWNLFRLKKNDSESAFFNCWKASLTRTNPAPLENGDGLMKQFGLNLILNRAVSDQPLMVFAARASSALQQIGVRPFVQLGVPIGEGERRGVPVIHGGPIIE
jgi:hypothetical protein